ncbi:MAG: flagellar hook-associated protein FlgK, partial [Leptolinea sp.]|nr:flagellar hook-associated protein FlgK [Leptolinea sp.]
MAGFSGINVALQTLLAQQAALEITQNNVANANTEGYHRQEAVMKAGYPTRSMAFTNSAGVQNIGTGVYVSTIKRYSLDFYETQYRNQLSQNSKYNMLADMLTEIEINLGDSSSDGITDRINNFFAGWQTVATDPDIAANREDLLETARALVEGFNDRAASLIRIQQDQNVAIKQRVDDVNSIAAQLAKLNSEIGRSQTETTAPNALFDERDRLLDKLASNIGTTVHIQDDGQVLVSIQGHAMVIGSRNFELETNPVAANNNLVQINWADDSTNTALEIQSGEIAGIMYARDVVIEDQLSRLDDSVTSLANRVNAIHRSGFNLIKPIPDTVDPTLITNLDAITGIDFFSLTSSSISLSGALNSYEGIGGTYDIAVDVLDGESASRQVT